MMCAMLVPSLALGQESSSSIDAGGYHYLAVNSDGTVWTWGYNGYGQLGDGTTTNRAIPYLTVNDIVLVSDTTAPATADNAPAGWSNKDVTVTLTASDSGSGVAGTYYMVDSGDQQQGTSVAITADGTHTISYWSVDQAGNTETPHTAVVQLDKTAPTITVASTTSANASGWYTSNVTVHFNCADTLSGIASCAQDSTISTESEPLGESHENNSTRL